MVNKSSVKSSLVAHCFQEGMKPQSNSLTAAKESIRFLMDLAANNNFELVSLDIKAAFLESKSLNRDVLVKFPEDKWKLKPGGFQFTSDE